MSFSIPSLSHKTSITTTSKDRDHRFGIFGNNTLPCMTLRHVLVKRDYRRTGPKPEFIPQEVQHRDAEVNYLSSVSLGSAVNPSVRNPPS